MSDKSVELTRIEPRELASESIIQAWRKAARADMTVILLPEAVKTLATILRDPHAKDSSRVAAARTVLDYSLGHVDDSAQTKQLAELSYAEIQEMLSALKEEARERIIEAKPVREGGEVLPQRVIPMWFDFDI